jgi:dihydrofolate synthase / folylpolyglutamate synthase
VTHFHNPRSSDPHTLAETVRQHGVAVQIELDPVVALAQARCKAQATDVICVTGSLYLVGEIKTRLQGLTPEF